MDNIVFKGSASNCFATLGSFSQQWHINIYLEDGKDIIFNHQSTYTNKKVIMKSILSGDLDKVVTNLKTSKEFNIQFGFTRITNDLLNRDMVITISQNNNTYILKINDLHNASMFKFPINEINTKNLLSFFERLNMK